MIALSRTSSSELLVHVAIWASMSASSATGVPIGMRFRRLHEGQRGQRILRQGAVLDQPGGPRLDGAQEPDERVLAPLPYHSRVHVDPSECGGRRLGRKVGTGPLPPALEVACVLVESALSTWFAAPHEPPVSERRQVGLENVHNKPLSAVEVFGLPRASV